MSVDNTLAPTTGRECAATHAATQKSNKTDEPFYLVL